MEQDIGALLKQINDRLKVLADSALQDSGLTLSQLRVMEFIHTEGGSVTQKEIEEHLRVSHPTVAGIVSRLEKNGFVECRRDEADKRNKIVSETQMAQETASEMYMERKNMEKNLLMSLSEEDVENLRRMLTVLSHNVGL
ncbi:MAG: MarR family winged helix-turn-helix transcriptional regulator [Anaerovoracaceae bacterium]